MKGNFQERKCKNNRNRGREAPLKLIFIVITREHCVEEN